MDIRKLREMVKEAKAEEAKYHRLAEDLELALKRATNGTTVPEPQTKSRIKSKGVAKSTLLTAIDVLREQRKPMHINDLLDMVSKRRGKLTPRASLESVLGTAIKERKHNLERPAPGTFEVRNEA